MTPGVAIVAGLLAGLGVAMPLGAIAVLILQQGVTGGFRPAAAAASAVAAVDTAYCVVALMIGAVAGPWIRSIGAAPGVVAGACLVALGVVGLVRLVRLRASRADGVPAVSRHPGTVFVTFLALTAVNPATVLYFGALSAAVQLSATTALGQVMFVVGVGLASLAWQLALAAAGSFLGGRITPRARIALSAVGYSVVVLLGVTAAGVALLAR
ncbi:LysE family transporter [Salinibacterium sp. ZJ454]|uniref:LysE family transporter n=1 Tax=Salinibacterium sp. ZJ454 TaxID=2708339 RepID=UPI001420544B|nr:LysE family transporter [Salinibacterium sp. ZJ454]